MLGDGRSGPMEAGMALTASRILGDDHGFAYMLERPDGTAVVTDKGEAVVLMRGMLYGTAEEMCAQMECVVGSAAPRQICAIVDASYASFRFPDANARSLFRRLHKCHVDVRRVVFAGMSRLVRIGFRAFAAPLLGAELRGKVAIVPDLAAAAAFVGLEWPLAARDPLEWLRARASLASLETIAPSAFEARYTADAHRALLAATREPPSEVSNAVYECHAQKRGSGHGLFGTRHWRDKQLWVCLTDADERTLVYRDVSRGDYELIVNPVRSELLDDGTCIVHARDRSYTFRFAAADGAQRFARALGC